jgi:signal transduction histidine kinase
MEQHALTRPLRVLGVCLHLLIAGLLALAVVRVVAEGLGHTYVVVAAAAAMGVVYAAGPSLPRVGQSRGAACLWLAVLGAVWLVLLWATPDGVWLAFPLFFLQLHLLPARWGLPAVAATAVAAIVGFAAHQGGLTVGMVIGPALGAAVAVATVLGYQALYRESQQRQRLIDELTAARHELATAEHSAGVAAERERLAREIHDTLAQGLSSIQLLLRAAERALPEQPETAAPHVAQARETAQHNLYEARRFVHALTPPDLDEGSLPAALERLAIASSEQTGLPVTFHLDGDAVPVPTPQEVGLLRIAQSALANTAQHAQASHAEITLTYHGAEVTLDVVDDGVGFDPATVPGTGSVAGGFGLAAMRTRARTLGGTLALESTPGRGTALAVTFTHQGGRPDE